MSASPVDRVVCTAGIMALVACMASVVTIAYALAFWHTIPFVR